MSSSLYRLSNGSREVFVYEHRGLTSSTKCNCDTHWMYTSSKATAHSYVFSHLKKPDSNMLITHWFAVQLQITTYLEMLITGKTSQQ